MTYRVITATLTARTAIYIGSGEGNDLTDALLRRDAEGRPIIPGTAIAGALRALLTRLAPRFGSALCVALTDDSNASCSCSVCRLFGDINPTDETESQSAASRLMIFNATPSGNLPRSLIRDGVGIDRVTGTAARAGSVKFDLEVLPAGATFDLRLELRDAAPEDEALLAAGLAEWQAGRLWLGGRVARGLGAFDLSDLAYKTLLLKEPVHLMTFLKDDRPWQQAQPQPDWLATQLATLHPVSDSHQAEAIARGWVKVTGLLQAEGPLLTNDTLTSGASGFDHAPLLVQWGDWRYPVLTGAGLRGVLRSHAERIARTIATHNVNGKDEFLQKCPACSPVESRAGEPLASCDTLLKEKISSEAIVDDKHLCLACRLFGSTRHGSRLLVEDSPFAGDKPRLKMLDFLAIDRFTGGGADGAKFDALALWKPAFALRLHLENPAPWELGWLALVLRDLAEGWLAVGFGAAKGFGRVRLKNWAATFGYLTPDDAPDLAQLHLTTQTSSVYTTAQVTEATAGWRALAQQWVDEFRKQVSENFARPKELALTQDSYFGRVDTLYPVLKGGAQ
ncbi:MAG TPA: RAMP superfamily CRISPR-associated protein [Anaerolineae bacterium]|nr:RAMP superfamily CRISPR-associated protein [Anaerolineae bacterium]HQH38019.1 RAMP superfamily CRISPR-associated protein [Anaerolineae bacterium]